MTLKGNRSKAKRNPFFLGNYNRYVVGRFHSSTQSRFLTLCNSVKFFSRSDGVVFANQILSVRHDTKRFPYHPDGFFFQVTFIINAMAAFFKFRKRDMSDWYVKLTSNITKGFVSRQRIRDGRYTVAKLISWISSLSPSSKAPDPSSNFQAPNFNFV